MAVYTGKNRHDKAVRSALKINFAVKEIINPALVELYPDARYGVRQSVGIDASELLVTRTGIRRANDLVWVGRGGEPCCQALGKAGVRYAGSPRRCMTVSANRLNMAKTSNRHGVPRRPNEIGNRRIYTSDFFTRF